MGQSSKRLTAEMKAFLCMSLVAAASAAPQLLAGHHGLVGHGVVAGGQRSHQSVSKPYQGEVRTTSQAKSFGSPIASVASSDSVSNTAQSGLASHLGQGAVVGHGLAHGVVGHGLAHGVVGHAVARPVVHAAP